MSLICPEHNVWNMLSILSLEMLVEEPKGNIGNSGIWLDQPTSDCGKNFQQALWELLP